MGDHFFPVVHTRRGDRCFHQAKVPGIQVGYNVEFVAIMTYAIFQFPDPGLNDREFTIGFVGINKTIFI